MIQLIKRMIFAWRYKRAVARACKYAKLYGRKYYVLYMGGKLKVVPKRNVCELIHRRRFRKGTTIRDIEKMALFITKPCAKEGHGTCSDDRVQPRFNNVK